LFDEGIKKYVGAKSAASYFSGLNTIDKNFTSIGIDAEYENDGCICLLNKIEKAKNEKGIDSNEKKNRQNYYSHLKKYICYRRFVSFKEWMANQPQKNNPSQKYSQSTINSMANLLKDGLVKLRVYTYNEKDCFGILTIDVFEKVYKNCYSAATEYDKQQGHSDFRNGLDFYKEFLNSDFNKAANLFESKLALIVDLYKDSIREVDKEERYKWEAIATYKKVWSINAEHFGTMFASAFRDSGNLLRSGNYYPYKMATAWGEKEPEGLRETFRKLFDESQPFDKRYTQFRDDFSKYYEGTGHNHYQDLHAVSVYLTFEFPEKYFFYKYSAVKDFIKASCYECANIDAMSDVEKMELTLELCNKVLAFIKQDEDLLDMHFSRLDDKCYVDKDLHILTQDIIYFGGKALNDSDGWWPTLDDYNPNLSKEDWIKFINEIENINHQGCMRVLKCFLEIGGEASSKALADSYGGHPSVYSSSVLNTSKRAIDYFGLKTCPDNDKERYFPVAFQGKNIGDSELYTYRMRNELFEALQEIDLSYLSLFYKEEGENEMTNVAKNTILYGPPGTGKTYNTVVYAVAIIENKTVESIKNEAYSAVLERYNTYKNDGLIEFTTFHQSYGYEEVIEGIKPILENDSDEQGDVKYTIEDGLFKAFCNKSSMPIDKKSNIDIGLNKTPTIWKVSLWATGDNPTRTECLENGHIRIGWDDYGAEITEDTDFEEQGGKKVLNAFISRMKIGDIVFSCYSSTTIDAIGVVTGDYEWCGEQYDDGLNRRRKVNWIVKGIKEDIVDINGGSTMTLSTVYRLKNIALSDAMAIIEKYLPHTAEEKKNHVFIIDEINRGNISKIFGELITLIEPSKRLGQTEGMKVKLPYSQQLFGVPDNVYLIGTMNTADRSIATIDTALRRRFRFKEMMPDVKVLNGINVEGISISDMLTRMNKRISVLYDREHTIGHAYFIPLKDNPTLEQLAEIFENGIVPLLQEYFYEDYEKIRLVLGDNNKQKADEQFILLVENDYDALFGSSDIGFDDSMTYEINKAAFNNIEAYKSI